MNKELVLREAQKIANEFPFWMVAGDITHLYGHVLETDEGKYDLEIKFNEDFPFKPPNFIYHEKIASLLGHVQLQGILNWDSSSSVVDILRELKQKIENVLSPSIKNHADTSLINEPYKNEKKEESEYKIFLMEDDSEKSTETKEY
ncbi:MAG: ubiquitin-conjugating enzyme E2, partial [Promethearchaeota archaeon]